MHRPDDWFERNVGFITFAGHVTAIRQRNAMIDKLGSTNTLLQRDEQRKVEHEQKQQYRRDTLYEINQAAKLIDTHYGNDPEQALYESYLLKYTCDDIGLHHSWFAELEWKDQCTETMNRLVRLIDSAFNQLSSTQVDDIEKRVQKDLVVKRAEEETKRIGKIPCYVCAALILPSTAARTGGKCMWCADPSGAKPTNDSLLLGCSILVAIVAIPIIYFWWLFFT